MVLGAAIALAAQAHGKQLDKQGKAYILHPLAVMLILNSKDEELSAIAVLHDVLEDTELTIQDLLNAGMSLRVLAGVQALTKRTGEPYCEYLERVKSNADATAVKLADLEHNLSFERMLFCPSEGAKRVKYYNAIRFLKGAK